MSKVPEIRWICHQIGIGIFLAAAIRFGGGTEIAFRICVGALVIQKLYSIAAAKRLINYRPPIWASQIPDRTVAILFVLVCLGFQNVNLAIGMAILGLANEVAFQHIHKGRGATKFGRTSILTKP